ncbi:MAG: quinol:cytochrome C oxidoreductase [Planctomycetota bacterium]
MERVTDGVRGQILLGEDARFRARSALIVGAAALLAGAAITLAAGAGWSRFLHGYLVAAAFCLSLALGALFFVILHHLTGARWSVAVRRLAEHLTGNLPWLALVFVPLLAGLPLLYEWSHADAVAQDEILQHKQPYLNVPFFLLRTVIYFAVWIALARYFFRRSADQDRTGDPELTIRMRRLSPVAMILLGLTLTFFAFDYLMSLDPHWYSTIFGVYYFAGSAVGFFAALAVVAHLLRRAGYLTHVVTSEHFHDIGKFVFAFVVFWAYIAFSQYLLIWYGNLPEETGYFLRRQRGGWGVLSLLLLCGHFIVPFLVLLSRVPKRRGTALALTAAWVLFMHWWDLYWLVMPQVMPEWHGFPVVELLSLTGLVGLLSGATILRMRRIALVAGRDPFLSESVVYENL